MQRRDFLRRALGVPAAYGGFRAMTGRAPALLRADSTRPTAPYGATVGDVVPGRAMVWSRVDRPAPIGCPARSNQTSQVASQVR